MIPTTVVSSTAQTLRDYQEACIQALIDAWSRGEIPLAWLATGAGKTTILAELLVRICQPAFQRALVFAHTKEIIEQIRDRVSNQYGELLQPYYGPYFAPWASVPSWASRIVRMPGSS
jgi:superfamily II DNA or RNA helicase